MSAKPSEIFTTGQSRIECIGESSLIEDIREWLGPVAPPAPAGMGDDCAVVDVDTSGPQLLTSDSLTYGEHFDASVSASHAGAKLIKRNLSDIAAMGGVPQQALLTLLCGPDLSLEWLSEFIGGIRRCCEQYELPIAGGDVSQISPGSFSAVLALTGSCPIRPVLRSTAKRGDVIYVTGSLGGSILGKHIHFEPRLAEGRWLAGQSACTAMMDLTDGLGKDLGALLPEGSSAAIDCSQLPLANDAHSCAEQDRRSAEEHAFCDGEDYELLFTLAPDTDCENFESAWRIQFPEVEITKIGEIVQADPKGIYTDAKSGNALPWQNGFEHFKKK